MSTVDGEIIDNNTLVAFRGYCDVHGFVWSSGGVPDDTCLTVLVDPISAVAKPRSVVMWMLAYRAANTGTWRDLITQTMQPDLEDSIEFE